MSLLDTESDNTNKDLSITAGGNGEDNITLCMVCESVQRQYKCPRCDYFTCSLKCCKQHKLEVHDMMLHMSSVMQYKMSF